MLQGVDMQHGLAIDNPKATLAVKRRLACEMVKYWQQVFLLSLRSIFKGLRSHEHMGLFFRIILHHSIFAFNSYCEFFLYFNLWIIVLQIKDSIPELPLSDGWAKKHTLFVKWKYAEAKVCIPAYHYFIIIPKYVNYFDFQIANVFHVLNWKKNIACDQWWRWSYVRAKLGRVPPSSWAELGREGKNLCSP